MAEEITLQISPREAAQALGVTIDKLAYHLGVSRPTLYRWGNEGWPVYAATILYFLIGAHRHNGVNPDQVRREVLSTIYSVVQGPIKF